MTVGMTVSNVVGVEFITVTTDEVMYDVVWPPYVGVGVVEVAVGLLGVGLLGGTGDGGEVLEEGDGDNVDGAVEVDD